MPTLPSFVAPALVAIFCAVSVGDMAATTNPVARPWPARWPARFAWSWDRREDLNFLQPGQGVALVVTSLEFRDDRTLVRPLRSAVSLPVGTVVLPVVHVEALASMHAALDGAQQQALVDAIVRAESQSPVHAVQVDFEALPSQREFYRGVLARVRTRRPDALVSITALASWCLTDRWTASLPVDEVVPMAFRMGPRSADYRQWVAASARWPDATCGSTGVASDEMLQRLPRSRRLYFFSPQPWTSERWIAQTSHYAGS